MRLGRAATYGVLAMLAIAQRADGARAVRQRSDNRLVPRPRGGNGASAAASAPAEAANGATARDIAQHSGIPCEYLRKVLQRLTRARLVRSERGRAGGFYLRRSLERITLLDVVQAIEGPVDEMAFFDDDALDVRHLPAAASLKRWRRTAASQLRELLRQTTLRDIIAQDRRAASLRS